MKMSIEISLDADGNSYLWQLYKPEINQYKDPNMYLWIRRCDIFINLEAIYSHLENLGIRNITSKYHEDFPELLIIIDDRNKTWYACKAPILGIA